MESFEDEIANEAEEMERIPSDDELKSLRSLAVEFAEKTLARDALAEEISELSKEISKLQTVTLPEHMLEIGQDVIGLPDMNLDVVLSPFCKAGISKSWDEERKEKAFKHLIEKGGESLIKCTLTIQADRGDMELMRNVQTKLEVLLDRINLSADVNLELSVHWGSLTSFVKEQLEKNEQLDLELLGATVGSIVKINKRK